MLDRDVIVVQRFRFVLGDAHERASSGETVTWPVGARSAQARQPADRRVDARLDRLRIGAGLRQDVGRDAALCSNSAASMCSGVVCVLCSCSARV